KKGVYFSAPHTVHIDIDVTIGIGTSVGLGALLLKGASIGSNCDIDAYSIIEKSNLADEVQVLPYSIIKNSIIQSKVSIGPFAHLRHNAMIGQSAVIGNFVEVSNSIIQENSKAKHLSYIGNARIGACVNIGAGTVTCNFDGIKKSWTEIGEHTSIGSNNALIAPVQIGKQVVTGAGSVITDNIPDGALAIARARQITKPNYNRRNHQERIADKQDCL
ncbi:MAG TPA: bifunctional UDP-N-acetylglucosamine diphosphorylase/glucosamine-1-phosphate N-acetyltransferase GlmU, partial [Candidatus Babeliaceae bacterium]|nr:bifunctional UDP-N-acetylglucosamine diphosphorylase/glucosamine-1-phosphate N-acetyltransferase GlmU [Candidatus Babeliaceae bacterium]